MVFTDFTWKYFSMIPYYIRRSMSGNKYNTPYDYEQEFFFKSYSALYDYWAKRNTQKQIVEKHHISKETLKKLEREFVEGGTTSLFTKLSFVETPKQLERLVILIKTARPHENASHALRLANALKIEGASLETIRQIQRCYGYGQSLDEGDIEYFHGIQHILFSLHYHKKQGWHGHDINDKAKTFYDYEHDHVQQRIELFKTLSTITKKRQTLPVLNQFGINSNRFYQLKNRYMTYGVWGLVDLVANKKGGEKISAGLELNIIEKRLTDPSLSFNKMIEKLGLKCSRSNVQKIYERWGLSKIKKPIVIRGVIPQAIPETNVDRVTNIEKSAKTRFPNLIKTSNLKVNNDFGKLIKLLTYKKIAISNPGAIVMAPFLEQLGVVEALHTYGPVSCRSTEITNDILINVLRIITGFPTINDFMVNSDRSVAIGAGLSINPKKSRLYDRLDGLRFEHLQKLRNDASVRAKELDIIEAKEIAIDYHCDPSDSRFPIDKSISKSPDKNGNIVYAHRPQIIWDSVNNTIINIAYCEGISRAPSALYKFCEENLFKIIEKETVREIFIDSEYTGERQLVYLIVYSLADVTMCLKQNKKIKKWRDETIKTGNWADYDNMYRIVSKDFTLAISGKPFRFVVKQNIETGETRCFGSTHIDYSPKKILDAYHIRWPVETGIKELIIDYYLDKPTGTSPEKIETHYYCIMIAKLIIDYFASLLNEKKWKTVEDHKCLLSTIRSTLFSNQNCQLSLNDEGDLLITYLDGDNWGIKNNLAILLNNLKTIGLNKVSWWGNKAVQIKVIDQFESLKKTSNPKL